MPTTPPVGTPIYLEPKVVQFNGSYYHVHPKTFLGMFRSLSAEEETDFRTWAMKQPEGTSVLPLWHPVVQDQLLTTGRGVL